VDVTLLKFKDNNFWFKKNCAVLGDSSKLNVADPVMALGSPLGYKWMGAVGHIMNLRIGKDFGYKEYAHSGLIVHSAVMNFGSSGGPLVNARGEVIGLNILINRDVNQIGMANRINDVKAIMGDLKNGVIR
jgi:serine protease Do